MRCSSAIYHTYTKHYFLKLFIVYHVFFIYGSGSGATMTEIYIIA
jgi:hypothetical protein